VSPSGPKDFGGQLVDTEQDSARPRSDPPSLRSGLRSATVTDEAESSKPKKADQSLSISLAARIALAAIAVLALILAARESHEAIGAAMVGATVAFGLAAAFYDRVLEVSTKGVKLADLKALEEAARREAPGASPDEQGSLVAESSEILARKRSAGEPITPDLALREASLSRQRDGLETELHFANWLIGRGWTVAAGRRFGGRELDLFAEKKGQRIAAEVKTLRQPVAIHTIYQVLEIARAVNDAAPTRPDEGRVHPVLLLGGEGRLTKAAAEVAASQEMTVYALDDDDRVVRLIGPDLV
jgi:hypothetical protein